MQQWQMSFWQGSVGEEEVVEAPVSQKFANFFLRPA
jgi:hypothetical protein